MADRLTLKSLPGNFGECFLPYKTCLRQRIQARKFANESYFESVKLYRSEDESVDVKATVYRSMLKNSVSHSINLTVGGKSITDAHCSCKAGITGECAHVLGVVHKVTDWVLDGLSEVPTEPESCTSRPQQWDRPRGPNRIDAEPTSVMVIAKSVNSSRKKKPLTADYQDNRKIQLLDTDITYLKTLDIMPISYLASKPFKTIMTEYGTQNEGSVLAYQLPLLQPVGPSQESSPCADLSFPHKPHVTEIPHMLKDKLDNVQISETDAVQLERNTKMQSECQLWHAERVKRITASNFGRFMQRKAAVTQKFVDSVCKPKSYKSQATCYGTANEKVARNMYRKKTNNHVHECGLVVNPQFPFIAATPDGKVCDKTSSGILEIKCPFSIRGLTITEALADGQKQDKLCVKKCGENIAIKETHPYWYQIQGQLLVTGAEFCDFVMYTRQDLFVQRIMPNKEIMEAILNKMASVYSVYM